MNEADLTPEERAEQAATQANRDAMRAEIRTHEAEYSSLPIVIVCAIPLLVFGSLLLSMLGLESKWWYLALVGIPALIGYFYPLILIDRLKTPLRLEGGKLATRWQRRKWLIGLAAALTLWLFRFEIYATLETLWNNWQSGW
ncbi:MAG TPA: hypothetical protein VFV30_01270 [Novosphingobium sp.]|nr:hypothetical protein [Novosphingobium sp.]